MISSNGSGGKKPRKKKRKIQSEHRIVMRSLTLEDYSDVKEIMNIVFPEFDGAWKKNQFEAQISKFPEGQICIEDNGKVVGAAISQIVKWSDYGDNHTYEEIVGKGDLKNHNENGDSLYGVDIFVHPEYRGLRLGRRLYDARKELCEKLNLKRIVVGAWMPGYENYEDSITPAQYIEKVRDKEIYDPVLSFQLANGFHVRKLKRGYFGSKKGYSSYAVLLEWLNIYYEKEETSLIGGQKTVVRVGIVQMQMRPVAGIEELMHQVEFFVDTVAGYNVDFVLFPEFFNASLLAKYNDRSPSDAMRALSSHTESIIEKMAEFAVSYNVNIISGSMPEYRDNTLHNVSYLCRRDGTYEEQYKLHITPDEDFYWGVKGGHNLSVFETDACKIGILICFDVEFPELPRFLAEQGMDILFVPFYTDTKNGYNRVRHCAMARAIENECYVVISGSVGGLPHVENMDIQYAQSAVFTPSDFAFPHDCVAAESVPNTEMTLIADLDLDLLKELRKKGSVRNLSSRRKDLYELKWIYES
ncbi:bifunctional GNAT family N-acetyltransferase/carbon-nitrogen hydrolase family protein [Leptospira santarosai]|uniref:bifunctional GNAT family N-acetyltransferase/carbon-nitrogen hydrolase family protein n=1 Tax=Leptospira santarosai TaxID=28183 RepID=UPI0009610D38|nr:bifunctional GNAT family N-acetyltransferase/carbon-nitrogen hydrolase family protein [Leptospira santarosai]OLY65363.1 hydrolase [Leptospira santarosai serovar Grippotyphosa]ONF78254.1 hydrolase [Leptospira santarosai serovar Bananal]